MATKSAGILLFAITLFFVSPSLGSLDIDGDGVPDVPLIVLHGSSGQNLQAVQIDRQDRIVRGISSPVSEPTWNNSGLMVRRNEADLRTAELDSPIPLRC